jgi:hypothetical protein
MIGHFGTLTVLLDQGNDSTVLTLKLDGVPVGKEEETEKNLEAFYIRGLKQIGYVMSQNSKGFPPITVKSKAKKSEKDRGLEETSSDSRLIVVMVLIFGIFTSGFVFDYLNRRH